MKFHLNGSRPLPVRLQIQWSRIFNPPGSSATKPARKLDARLAALLFTMPSSVTPDDNPLTLLAVRTLLRGTKLGVPSVQKVPRAPLSDPLWLLI